MDDRGDAALGAVTKTDSVYAHLRRAIVAGTLSPQTPLRQERIAAGLGVSATPVREAFRRLEAEGLVRRDPHRGVVVGDGEGRMPGDMAGFYDVWLNFAASASAVPGSDFP